MRYNEKKGHWPLVKAKTTSAEDNEKVSESSSEEGVGINDLEKSADAGDIMTSVRNVGLSS